MPKSVYHIDDTLPVPRRIPRAYKVAVCVFLAIIAFPFVMETLLVWIAQWFKVMDKPLAVKTPLLDLCEATFGACRDDLAGWAAYHSDAANLNPHASLLIAALLLVIAARILRK